jgi:hypothetical protein
MLRSLRRKKFGIRHPTVSGRPATARIRPLRQRLDLRPIGMELLIKVGFHILADIPSEPSKIGIGRHLCLFRQVRNDVGIKDRVDVLLGDHGALAEKRRLRRFQRPRRKPLTVGLLRQRGAAAWRYPEDTLVDWRLLAPHEPRIRCCRRGVGVPATLDHGDTFDERRVDSGRPVPEQPLISPDAFDPLRPHQHGNAVGGEIKRSQCELTGSFERRIRDDPCRDNKRLIMQKIVWRFAEAVVEDV